MRGACALIVILCLAGCGDRVAVSAPAAWTGTWRDPAGRGFLTIGGDSIMCALDGLPAATWTMASAVEQPEVPGAGIITTADGAILRVSRGSAGIRGVKVAMLDIDVVRAGSQTARYRLYADPPASSEPPGVPGKQTAPPTSPDAHATAKPSAAPRVTPAAAAAVVFPPTPVHQAPPVAPPVALSTTQTTPLTTQASAVVQRPETGTPGLPPATSPPQVPARSAVDDGRNAAFRAGTPDRWRQATAEIIAAPSPAQAHATWLAHRRQSYQQAISAATTAAALAAATDDPARRARAMASLDAILADLLLHERAYQTWRAEGPP